VTDHPISNLVQMPTELGALDTLLHKGEANPRTRSGIMGVEILETTPEWRRFYSGFENASRRVLRMRQKVVMPTLPTASPRWVVDPDFNLDYHVRRARVPEPGTLRELLDMAELMIQSPHSFGRWGFRHRLRLSVTIPRGAGMLAARTSAPSDDPRLVTLPVPVAQ
jgi:hypothetical protein